MNLKDITDEITNLENGPANYKTCEALASMYIIRNNYHKEDIPVATMEEIPKPIYNDIVVKEYNDILPTYNKYCEVKKEYHKNKVTENAVFDMTKQLALEIKEFIQTLYANTDTQHEKQQIQNMIQDLKALY